MSSSNYKNEIHLPLNDEFDELSLVLYQNSSLDAVEIMAFLEPDYDKHLHDPDNVDDRAGTQCVVVKSVKELRVLLKEVKHKDYRRFNTVAKTETEENDDE